ncbi:hypothetical protein ABWH89_18795 [Hoeflea alexandrii]|uniref:hypothetical protein n=1 Tax=Hoeflea alexandrii TaxID=288436 RepID=UPI0035D11189
MVGEALKQVVSIPYHQPAFMHLTKIFEDEIRFSLTQKYANLRGELFLSKFEPGVPIDNQTAWDFAREALDVLDARMGEILSKRSVAYWLHIYRRIGVFLSPDHEDKTDAVTIGLVRQIAELAIQKHGRLESNREFGSSMQLSPNLILGGWMKKGFKALGGNKRAGERLFQQYSTILRRNPALVLREFGKKDFLGIYEVEGAAYQYCRLTALLRSLGKGASIQIDEDGDWHYLTNVDLSNLIISIDQRNQSSNTFSSLLGVWVDNALLMNSDEFKEFVDKDANHVGQSGTVFFSIYNVHRVDMGGLDFYGYRLPRGSVTNFFPFYFHVGRFLQFHSFMQAEFIRRRGYGYDIFLSVLEGLSSFSILPEKALYTTEEELIQGIKLDAFMQTLSRGYHVFIGSSDHLCEMLVERIKTLLKKDFNLEEVRRVVASLSLDVSHQSRVSPWSGGPRAIIIPGDNAQIVDFVSIPSVLQTLFVFMPDKLGGSGTVFEKLFRDALMRRGYDLKSGDVFSEDGKQREMDAGVQIGDCLYLFECVSVERPLDYQIGKPKSISVRNERLATKLKQVEGLNEFIARNPAGRNYDYSTVKRIEHFVVSPFVEWVWSFEPTLWSDLGFPRLVSPDEAFLILDSAA